MLPFLKKNQEASVYLEEEHKKRESDEESDYDMLESAAEDLLSAIQSRDIKAIASALKAAFEMCDSQPHEEGENE